MLYISYINTISHPYCEVADTSTGFVVQHSFSELEQLLKKHKVHGCRKVPEGGKGNGYLPNWFIEVSSSQKVIKSFCSRWLALHGEDLTPCFTFEPIGDKGVQRVAAAHLTTRCKDALARESTLHLPDCVYKLEHSCFNWQNGCPTYECLGVEEIGDYAFTASDAEYIVFGDNLKSVGAMAFYRALNLKRIEIMQRTDDIANAERAEEAVKRALDYVGSDATVDVVGYF